MILTEYQDVSDSKRRPRPTMGVGLDLRPRLQKVGDQSTSQ